MKIVVLILLLVAAATAAESEDCSEFTYSQCQLEEIDKLVTLPGSSIANCQSICNTAYAGDCNTVFFDHGLSECIFARANINDHISTCSQQGGPNEPNVKLCSSPTDPCNYFHEEECAVSSERVGIIGGVQSARNCQKTCKMVPTCNYFLYNNNLMECGLYAGKEKTCSTSASPATPLYQDCNFPSTTTTIMSQPTTTSSSIPSACERSPFEKSNGQCACVFYLPDPATMEEARNLCKEAGGRLPEIYSEQDNNNIMRLLNPDASPWLGGSDALTEGTWIWEDSGEPFTWHAWGGGPQPDPGSENCLIMWNDENHEWHNVQCDLFYNGTVCEILFDC